MLLTNEYNTVILIRRKFIVAQLLILVGQYKYHKFYFAIGIQTLQSCLYGVSSFNYQILIIDDHFAVMINIGVYLVTPQPLCHEFQFWCLIVPSYSRRPINVLSECGHFYSTWNFPGKYLFTAPCSSHGSSAGMFCHLY